MDKSFDNIFKNKIQQSFEAHQEPFNPDDWDKMEAKLMEEKNRKLIWLPLLTKAASIVLLVGITALFFYKLGRNDYNKSISETKITNFEEKHISNNDSRKLYNNDFYNLNRSFTGSTVLPKLSNKTIFNNFTFQNNFKTNKPINQNYNIRNNNKFVAKNNTKQNSINNQKNKQIIENNFTVADTNKYLVENNLFDTDTNTFVVENIAINDSLKIIKKIVNKDSLLAEIANIKNDNEIIVSKKKNQKFDLGVSMSSLYNYSDIASTSSPNIGGGIVSNYWITKNIAFNSGISISQQSINFETEALASNVYSDQIENFSNMQIETIDSKHTFVGIDIPVNISFKANNFMFTTGFSSIAYIYESNEYNYYERIQNNNYDGNIYNLDNAYTLNATSSTTKNYFPQQNNLDLVKLLNISAGYRLPLKKGSFIVEPYVKYPIGKRTSQNIKLGLGGVTLQYMFL